MTRNPAPAETKGNYKLCTGGDLPQQKPSIDEKRKERKEKASASHYFSSSPGPATPEAVDVATASRVRLLLSRRGGHNLRSRTAAEPPSDRIHAGTTTKALLASSSLLCPSRACKRHRRVWTGVLTHPPAWETRCSRSTPAAGGTAGGRALCRSASRWPSTAPFPAPPSACAASRHLPRHCHADT